MLAVQRPEGQEPTLNDEHIREESSVGKIWFLWRKTFGSGRERKLVAVVKV